MPFFLSLLKLSKMHFDSLIPGNLSAMSGKGWMAATEQSTSYPTMQGAETRCRHLTILNFPGCAPVRHNRLKRKAWLKSSVVKRQHLSPPNLEKALKSVIRKR